MDKVKHEQMVQQAAQSHELAVKAANKPVPTATHKSPQPAGAK